jgi:hypothetical protein
MTHKTSYVNLTRDYVDRASRLRHLQGVDVNISKADLGANIFVLVVLLGFCVYLTLG